MKNILEKIFNSRKFWYTVVGVLTTLLSDYFRFKP